MSDNEQTPWDYFVSKHDWLSQKFVWHEQHTNERLLDLSGFISLVSGKLEPDGFSADDVTMPFGFFEVEPRSRIGYVHLIFLFTVLERRARDLCRAVRESDPEIMIDLRDLAGTLFERLKTFSEKAAKVPVPDPLHWEGLRELQKVRDCIIHCGGSIRESRDADYIRKLISRGCGLAESTRGYLQIDQSYRSRAEEIVLKFLTAYFSATHAAIRERLYERQLAKGI